MTEDDALDDLIREAFLYQYRAEVIWLLRRRQLVLLLRDAARTARGGDVA